MPSVTRLPDIHEWYSPERVAAEEAIWAEGQHYLMNAKRIQTLCDARFLTTIIEFGCGTGWIPTVLSRDLDYLGLDANPYMLKIARTKSDATFVRWDFRFPYDRATDLACSFAVLKHFSLTDWPVMLRRMLQNARFGLFNQHCLQDDRTPFDDGKEWHSIWPRNSDILAAIEAYGHILISRDDSIIDPLVGAPETYFVTQRRSNA